MNLLLIYRSLSMGGIETFFLRMAKARHKNGMKTKLLLTAPKSKNSAELLNSIQKYCDVIFLEDYVPLPKWLFKFIPGHFLLLLPIKSDLFHKHLKEIDFAHTSGSIFALFFLKLLKIFKFKAAITIGVYHSREYTWHINNQLPYYEMINRSFFSCVLPKENILFFNEKLIETYESTLNTDFSRSSIFPLGVVDKSYQTKDGLKNERLTIGSVGRLVNFKTYNLWMLDVIKQLKESNIIVKYIIYGEGPLKIEIQKKIQQYGLSSSVELKGELEYSKFNSTVKEFDLFIGSGTAIVEAASMGVPSIIAIESISEPYTYGFLSAIPGFTYHEDYLYEKVRVVELILDYVNLNPEEKIYLQEKHISWASKFSMDTCVTNFEKVGAKEITSQAMIYYLSTLMLFKYSFSYFSFSIRTRFYGKSLYEVVYG